jgi:hypothetical protein
MSARLRCASLIGCLSLVSLFGSTSRSRAVELLLADAQAWPGRLWTGRTGELETLVHQREATANPAFPHAAMKLGHVAAAPSGEWFYASGLDGYVMQLLDHRNEVQVFEHPGQIRDVACTDEEHVVYFSVVPTPQNSEPLADGKIYRRDLWQGAATELATVRQADVGGKWWGCFTVRRGMPYLATLEEPSRIYKLTSTGPERVFAENRLKITGLAASGNEFLVVAGGSTVYRTSDFAAFTEVFHGEGRFTDAAPARLDAPAADSPAVAGGQ